AVHGWQLPAGITSQGMSPPPVRDAELIADTDQMLTALVDEALAGVEAPPVIEKRPVPLGGSQALLREAKGAEVLVVGSRGRGGFAGLLLGSTSQQCLHHSPCTIVVVPAHRSGVAT
ncbi:MAG: uspA3, partial [Acidimicrobiales bacterium]|nr:uspA3 [Acidimicrobiales bacterium]